VTAVEHFDIHVFGGGNAGKTLAMDQAKVGWHVAVIETGMIGGSCINIACIPSKALIFTVPAEIARGWNTIFGALKSDPDSKRQFAPNKVLVLYC
jgi:probable pyridine nucleotide-disulfide oxidoreductase